MIIDLLRQRYSLRKYRDKCIPYEVIKIIVEAGRLSPSGGNQQPWMFGVITDPDLIARIAEAAHRQSWIACAPLVIVLCTIGVEDARGGRDIQCDRYPEYAARIRDLDRDLYWALNQEEHQTKIAGTHMVLAALERGVGSCWVSRFEVRRLAEVLRLPARYLPAELLIFGYPSEDGHQSEKKALTEVVFYNALNR
jgi:nitroreductase